jgi:mRNA-degrading endonuclease toxin of MazEF toxin-antitoxin module
VHTGSAFCRTIARVLSSAVFVSAAALVACGGGGAGSAGGAAPVVVFTPQPAATATATAAPGTTGTLGITFTIPIPHGSGSAAKARGPAYISPNTRSVSFYDGKTLVYVANIDLSSSPATVTTVMSSGNEIKDLSCQMNSDGYQAQCTERIEVSCGSHTFDMIAYPNPQTKTRNGVGGGGIILSEGQLGAYTVKQGDNGSHEIILLGVADIASFAPITTPYTYSDGVNTYANVGVVGVGTYTISATIEDASGATIVLPGAYDNGPVIFSESDGANVLSFTPASYASPPASPAPVSFTVQCVNPGVATIAACG